MFSSCGPTALSGAHQTLPTPRLFPFPSWVPADSHLPLLKGNLSNPRGYNNQVYSENSLISTFSPHSSLTTTFSTAGFIVHSALLTIGQTKLKPVPSQPVPRLSPYICVTSMTFASRKPLKTLGSILRIMRHRH